MKKKDLKSGMMLKFKGQSNLSLVLIGTENGDQTCNLTPTDVCGFVRHFNYFGLDGYNEDLTSCNNVTKDIIAVYGLYGNIVWERQIAIPELTMEEAIEKIGFEFKIKK